MNCDAKFSRASHPRLSTPLHSLSLTVSQSLDTSVSSRPRVLCSQFLLCGNQPPEVLQRVQRHGGMQCHAQGQRILVQFKVGRVQAGQGLFALIADAQIHEIRRHLFSSASRQESEISVWPGRGSTCVCRKRTASESVRRCNFCVYGVYMKAQLCLVHTRGGTR